MKNEIGFVCIGQAGGNIGNLFDELGFNVLYINTSQEDLDTLKGAKHVYHIPGGEGCSKNRDKAKGVLAKSVDQLIERIKAQFSKETFIGVIFATGGGTGSGIGPYLVDFLVNEELFDEDGYPTHTVFTVPILPSIKETPLARFNSRECFGELVEIENLGATFVINNEEPDSCNLDYDKYKLSLNKKFVSNFCSFIEIPEKHKSEAGNIDKAEIKEVLSTPGMAVISVTPRKTNVAQMIEDLEHSPLFAPIDTDLKNRKLKYIASSTIEPLNYGALTQAFGIYYDEYHTFNQEKNIVCLSGLRMPFSTVQAIGNSADSLAADLAKSVNEEDENPLAGKGSAVFSNLRAGKPNRRGPRKMVSVETDQETGEKRERKISNRRKNLLERYGGRK